jgi:peptidoglycan/LPS O-acetylase OafA/YrhL
LKPHYPILDGLRGTAAITVVAYHLLEACYPEPVNHPIHHGYLAVDFFYLLSGFVVGYAYDDRWGSMSIIGFLRIRLIRLHPLVILGVVIGAISFWIDPYTNGAAYTTPLKLIATMLISFTLLPSPDLRGGGETHSLDGTCWSLLQEYVANVLYALFGRKLSMVALSIFVGISAITLILAAQRNGDLSSGWDYHKFWIGGVRVMFPFFAGLLLFRTGRFIKIPMAYTICSALLIGLFLVPTFKFNGLYEAGCIIIAFPLIIAAGAGGIIIGRWAMICKFFGAISYPIYILHYPFIYIYTAWIQVEHPGTAHIVATAIMLFIFFILLAWVALKFYDQPLRLWLKRKYLINNVPVLIVINS